MQEKIIILDFGSQTTQLIGRRLRELNVYCEIVPYNKFPQGDASVKGVILSGSPFSVYDKSAFKVDLSDIRGKYPILGICYGAQFISYSNGGRVEPAGTREYGRAHLGFFDSENILFKGIRKNTQVWMSHGDTITAIPDNFKVIASTDKVAIAAYQVTGEKIWGVQFHPEVYHSEDGTQMLRNFVVDVCGCSQSWSAASFVDTTVTELKEQLGNDRVILGLSGRRVAASCHWQESDLYFCRSRSAPQERIQECDARLRVSGTERDWRRCQREVFQGFGGSDRARTEA